MAGAGLLAGIPCIPHPPSSIFMANQIKLPNLGENIESGDVLTIFVREGDTVKANQDLLEVETDKATFPVPAPQAGKITKVLVTEGETINIGATIMEFEPSGAEAGGVNTSTETQKKAKPKTAEPKEPGSVEVVERAKEADVVGGDVEDTVDEKPAAPASKKPRLRK